MIEKAQNIRKEGTEELKEEKMLVSSKDIVLSEALGKIDRSIKRLELGDRDAMHLRLLAEETLGMLKLMTDDFAALMWLDKNGSEASVHLTAKTQGMEIEDKKELLSVSSTGKNASAKGIMGKIGDVFENSVMNLSGLSEHEFGYYESDDYTTTWSLERYKDALEEAGESKGFDIDLFEKSIVASLAKDVVVGVKKDNVEMTILMELTGK